MRFDFLFTGKTKETYCAEGIDIFLKRLNHYAQAEIRIMKEQKTTNHDSKTKQELVGAVLDHIRRPSFVIMLDNHGQQKSSENLAKLLTNWENAGHKRITFYIGGAFGIPERLLSKADFVLSLSRMTFTHDMARLILLEQLYRAFTIKAGTGYHK